MSRTISERRYVRLTSEQRRNELVQAGLSCMARGGIQEFTVDKVCAEAGVSRGLITHHFGSMNGLLLATFETMAAGLLETLRSIIPGELRIVSILDGIFAPENFNRATLGVWLSLWGQIATNPVLQDAHIRVRPQIISALAEAIDELATARDRLVDAFDLANSLVSLLIGLGLQHCLHPEVMPMDAAKAACHSFLRPHFGELSI